MVRSGRFITAACRYFDQMIIFIFILPGIIYRYIFLKNTASILIYLNNNWFASTLLF